MNRGKNSSTVGTSRFVFTSFLTCLPRASSSACRCSPHAFAPDLEPTGAFTRSRYSSPSGHLNMMSTSHPLLPRFLYCLTFTLITETSSATAHALRE